MSRSGRGSTAGRGGVRATKSGRVVRGAVSTAELDAMIQAATVDCYNESEEVTGWLTVIQDNLAVPFETRVLGTQAKVQRIELDAAGQIVAVCARGQDRQTLPILDLPLPSPGPAGVEWIEAYRRWLGGR